MTGEGWHLLCTECMSRQRLVGSHGWVSQIGTNTLGAASWVHLAECVVGACGKHVLTAHIGLGPKGTAQGAHLVAVVGLGLQHRAGGSCVSSKALALALRCKACQGGLCCRVQTSSELAQRAAYTLPIMPGGFYGHVLYSCNV